MLFTNIAHVWSFKHFVFVYLQDVQGVRKMCQPKNFLVSPKICTDGEKNSTSVPDMLAAFCISGHKRHPAVTSSMNRIKENDDYIFLFPGRKFRKPPTVPFILLSKKFLQTIKIKGLIWWMGGKSLLSHDFKILYSHFRNYAPPSFLP